ncbi:DNA polymerase III subunit delta [Parvularcula sp. IMCC14364]|uniref:DNA polymerase III subunit delta n=1 Tax=Parvularcula sp. IMCC14364 TaxID=3067902 RepID=UPI002742363C|nr:DNA polymerase III subunit delta [Parvularcula sp. IMCC14364]
MSAIKPKDVSAFLKKRNPSYKAVLIYGPDGGAVRERSNVLARQVVKDLSDPFSFIELSEADLKETPSRLVDEAAAFSFAGGERVVRVTGSGETVTSSARLLLNALEAGTFEPNALTLIEAGELRKTSGLRKLFEGSNKVAAIACYEDNIIDLRELISQALQEEDLTISRDGLEFLAASLGQDRGVSRAEIEKIILYKDTKDQRSEKAEVSLLDVQACLADATQDTTFDIASFSAAGEPAKLSAALQRAVTAGTSPIMILIFLQRHFARLYTVQSLIGGGMAKDAAMKKLRPPIFFAEQRNFENQLRKWPLPRLEKAVADLLETEHASKRTGAPQQELIERAALRLAVMAK